MTGRIDPSWVVKLPIIELPGGVLVVAVVIVVVNPPESFSSANVFNTL